MNDLEQKLKVAKTMTGFDIIIYDFLAVFHGNYVPVLIVPFEWMNDVFINVW